MTEEPKTLDPRRTPARPDLAAAQLVADHIGTVHHGFEYTLQ